MRPIPISVKQYRFVLFLFLLYLFCASRAQAQTFAIPDVNFRNCLKETYPHIFNASDEVIIDEAKTITTITCASKGIQNIEGIGYFENVEVLNFNSNQLQQIADITNLGKLRLLICQNNQLTACPYLSGNPLLETLALSNNQITAFPDITNNLNLKKIAVEFNQITNVPALYDLTVLSELAVGHNPLQHLPDLFANTALTTLDISYTNLQDFPFLSWNTNLSLLFFSGNPQFSFPNLSANTKLTSISCAFNNLSFIPDLGALTDLEYFVCNGNNLSALPDLSSNLNLKYINCADNDLTQLPELSQCSLLEALECNGNRLTSLPALGNNTHLSMLYCYDNMLTSLPDLANTRLEEINSNFSALNNRLTFEDILPIAGPVAAAQFEYNPQQKFGTQETRILTVGRPFVIDLNIDGAVSSNVYTWYKDEVPVATNSSNVFTIDQLQLSDGGVYRVTVTNPGVPGMTLESEIITLTVKAPGWIADDNLRACLKETYPQVFDASDGVIIEEALKITAIGCVGKGIESIEGIEYFENVDGLGFKDNDIQQLPGFSGLTKVRILDFTSNKLSSIPDLSSNTELAYMEFAGNQITSVPDLTNNLKLRTLGFQSNQLQSLPDLSANVLLETMQVGYNPLKSLPDLSANTNLIILEFQSTDIPSFPDLSHNRKLMHLSFAGNDFGVFPDLSNNTALQVIICSGNNLSSIPDLSGFLNLTYLSCNNNHLSALPDLSKNPKLKGLQCFENDLVQLPDLSKCPQLEHLECSNNDLTSLPDLSNNTKLFALQCFNNNLTSLPALANTKIGSSSESLLEVFNNQLTFEDLISTVSLPTYKTLIYKPQKKLSGNTTRTVAPGTPFTVDLDIDDGITSNVYTWYKDGVVIATTGSNVFTIDQLAISDAGSYRATVTNPAVPGLVLESGVITLTVDATLGWIPDDNFRACLKENYPHIFNSSDALIIAEAQAITEINCFQKGIRSIDGIGYFTNVENLELSTNEIQAIPNITGLTKLRDLYVMSNQLTSCPDLRGNTDLKQINFVNNRISVFPDISNNLKLEGIWITSNQIQSLPDLSAHTLLTSLWLGYNPLQNVPDLSHNTKLVALHVSKTQITTLPDLTHNTDLRLLYFGNNPQLPAFPDLTHNTNLTLIDCSSNDLTAIPDLGALTQLSDFNCSGNKLTSLPDLSKNVALTHVSCIGNALLQLPDLSKCPQLTDLYCGTNNLTALPDLSNNTQLTNLYCQENDLTSLPDLSNTKIGTMPESTLYIPHNLLTFEDILPIVGPLAAVEFEYKPQKKITADASRTIGAGEPFAFDFNIDANVTGNVYTWYKNDVAIATTGSNSFVIEHVQASDAGAYRATVTNPAVPGLVLESGIVTLTVDMGLGWIADDNFRACLKATYPWVFNNEDYVILSEVVTIKDINCNDKGIKDISGIEYFINAENVYLQRNQISDISMLPALTKVYRLAFDENNISAIPDMSASPALQQLHFSQNNFSVFPDATANTNMKVLDFRNNHITSVPDLSAYQNLMAFSIGFNPITELPDLSGLPWLYSVEFAGTNLSTFPDLSGIERLSDLNFGHNPQFSTWPANFPTGANLTHINCESNDLSVIPSLSIYPNLDHLNVAGNKLTEIPGLSSLTELFALICNDNKLTTLGSFSTTRLQAIIAHNNELTSLPDLSGTRLGSPAFTNLFTIFGNHLTMEDLLPAIKGKTYDTLNYAPQTIAGVEQVVRKDKNESFEIDINMDDAVTNNVYTWYKDGAQVATTSVNKLTISSVQAQHAGVYTCVITNPDLPELEIVWKKTTLEVNTVAPPWTPVAGGVGNHVVVIPADLAVDIYGTAIQSGDYIGIFFKDDQNALQLSGSARWTGAGAAITVWSKSDQGSKNGFVAGEEMTVMVWKAGAQQSYTMSATYDAQAPYTDQGNFRTNGFSKILSLSVAPACQRINLHNGWNLISTYVVATNPSMATIFGTNNGIVVKDASGKILYAPEFGITSGTWNVAEGYLVYSSAEQFFEVCGKHINPTTPIALVKNAYPAFLPYYGNAEIPVGEGLNALGTNFSYAQTIIYAGNTAQALNYIPAHVINPPIDQIGTMKPGLAYKILLQNSVPAFRYPARISNANGRLRGDTAAIAAVNHYGTVKPVTVNNAVLVIPDHIFGGALAQGDEVAVFNSAGEMIGAVSYSGAPMAVTLWEHESSAVEDRFSVRLWRMETGSEHHVDLSYAGGGEGKFIPNTLLVANAAQVRQTGEFGVPVKVFPNPAAQEVQFGIHTARAGVVRVVLYDMMGVERGTLFNDRLEAGEHRQAFDLSAFPSGQYIYKVSADNKVTSDKLMIIK